MAVTTFLANNLAYLSEKRGVALSTVARDLGMSPSSLLRLSRDEAKARLSTLAKVAQYFGVNATDIGSVDLTAPGALEAASAGGPAPQSSVSFTPRPVVDAPAPQPAVEPAGEGVPVLTCEKALELKGARAPREVVVEWLPHLPEGRYANASLFAVKAPSATMAPSIRQGDYLYLRSASEGPYDPVATVLAEVGAGEGFVFSLGTIVAKSSAEWLLVGVNPVTGLEPRPVRQVVGIVVAVLSVR